MSSREYFSRVASQWDGRRASFFSEAVRDRVPDVAGVEAGRKEVAERKLFSTVCPRYVRDAAEIVEVLVRR